MKIGLFTHRWTRRLRLWSTGQGWCRSLWVRGGLRLSCSRNIWNEQRLWNTIIIFLYAFFFCNSAVFFFSRKMVLNSTWTKTRNLLTIEELVEKLQVLVLCFVSWENFTSFTFTLVCQYGFCITLRFKTRPYLILLDVRK